MTCVLAPKFSASGFWDDCRQHGVTVIQYVGEILRYLCNTPQVRCSESPRVIPVKVSGRFGPGLTQWPSGQGVPRKVSHHSCFEDQLCYLVVGRWGGDFTSLSLSVLFGETE